MIHRYYLLYAFVFIVKIAGASNPVLGASNSLSNTLTRMPDQAFIENKGQLNDMDGKPASDVLYYLNLKSKQVFITKTGLTYAFYMSNKHHSTADSTTSHIQRVDANFTDPHITKDNIEVADVAGNYTYNFYKPGCKQGLSGLKTYKTIKVRDIYPGIDWVITVKDGIVKYSFNIAPHANVSLIELGYLGAGALNINSTGGLDIYCHDGYFEEKHPQSFQNGVPVESHFVLQDNKVSFACKYDNSKPLTIDPQLSWGTLIGGYGDDHFFSITTDKWGNLFATGQSSSGNFPGKHSGSAYYASALGSYWNDIIICKFDPSGVLLWSTFYGGSDEDIGNSIKTDTSGNVFITGSTKSTDFVLKTDTNFIDTAINIYKSSYYFDAFLIKFNNSGSLIYSTLLGGYYNDMGFGLVVDPTTNNLIVVGRTAGPGFPIKFLSGAYNSSTSYNTCMGFISRFSNRGALMWSTLFGSTDTTMCLGVTVDKSGNIFVVGLTDSTKNFPLKKGSGYYKSTVINSSKHVYDGFIAKFDNSSALSWSTLYGGSGNDLCVGVDADPQGNIAVTGETGSTDFPIKKITGGINDSTLNLGKNKSNTDVFLLKFDGSGNRLWGTLFGGSSNDLMLNHDTSYYYYSRLDNYTNILESVSDFYSNSCVVDACGNIYIGFTTNSNDVKTLNAGCDAFYDNGLGNNQDCFVAKFTGSGVQEWGTYMGGASAREYGVSLALNRHNDLYTTWVTDNPNGLPYDEVSGSFYDDKSYSNLDIFISKFNNPASQANINWTKCGTGCTGYASVNVVTSCPGVYKYLWSTGAKTQSIDSLCSGSYSVIVKDTVQCAIDTAYATLKQGAFYVQPSYTPVSCQSTCDGKASAMVNGVTGAKYEWHFDSKVVKGVSSINSICPGLDTLIVSVTGCGSQTVTFNESNPPQIKAYLKTITPPICNTACNAKAEIVTYNGEKSLTATWSNGVKGTTDTGMCPGKTYTVSISDSSCYKTSLSVSIPKYKDSAILKVNSPCGCNTTASVVKYLYGGNPPYKYKWSNGDTGSTAIKLCPGNTYNVVVKSKCATDTESITIPSYYKTWIYLQKTASCHCDGTAIAFGIYFGDTVHYKWSTGDTTQRVTGLCPGKYWVIVYSRCGRDTQNFTIVKPSKISILNIYYNSGVCNGKCNAYAWINDTGGSVPKHYQWSSGDTFYQTATHLCRYKTYYVKEWDNCGDTTRDSVTIIPNTRAPAATFNIVTYTCPKACAGVASLNVYGGTYPYQIKWQRGDTVDTVSGLCSGTRYRIKLTDACGSTDTMSFVFPQANALVATTGTSPSCAKSCLGIAYAYVTGGVPPYKYLWNNGDTMKEIDTACPYRKYKVKISDLCGTISRDSVTITVGVPLSASVSVLDTPCNNCLGVAQVNYTGGHAKVPLIQWSNGPTTISDSSLCSDSLYTVIATDPGCKDDTIKFRMPHKVRTAAVFTSISPSCPKFCNGKATVKVNRGSPPYSYHWSNGDTSATSIKLCLGQNYVVIKDACNRLDTFTVKIPAEDKITATFSSIVKSCPLSCNGGAVINASKGISPYTYIWNTGDTTASVSDLCKGNNSVIVTDVCSQKDTFTVFIDSVSIHVKISSFTNTNCYDTCNGTATVIVTGGKSTNKNLYKWSNGQTGATATGLCKGTYTVVGYQKNCISSMDSITITQIQIKAVISPFSDANCSNVCNGYAGLTVTGGSAPYKYKWSNGDTTSKITKLCAGTYTVYVTKPGCTSDTTNITIKNTPPITGKVNYISPDCWHICNGKGFAEPSGGQLPYKYLWSTGDTTKNVTGLCPKTYTLIIYNPGCYYDTLTFSMSAPLNITASIDTTSVSCYTACNATAIAKATGGETPYFYKWSTKSTKNSVKNLCPGKYWVVVYDTGCAFDTVHFEIANPGKMSAHIQYVNPYCNNLCNGSVRVITSKGVAPFKYLWNTGDTIDTLKNLCIGTYTVIITQPACSADTERVTLKQQTPVLIHFVSQTNNLCFDTCEGSISVYATGGSAHYKYYWNSKRDSATVYKLCAGTYYLQVKDSVGCTVNDTFYISQPHQIQVTQTRNIESHCENPDGLLAVKASGGIAPYKYAWDNGSLKTTDSGIAAGNYTVTVADSNNCSRTFVESLNGIWPKVYAAPDTEVYYGNPVKIRAWGTLKYLWSPVSYLDCDTCNVTVYRGLKDVQLCITGIDTFGCTDTACINILLNKNCGIPFLPDAFTPNSDGTNDIFRVLGNCLATVHLRIYDRWGQMVYESFAQKDGWSGMYGGKPANQAVYMWVLDATNLFGQSFKMKGDVTLIR